MSCYNSSSHSSDYEIVRHFDNTLNLQTVCSLTAKLQIHTLFGQVRGFCETCLKILSGSWHLHAHRPWNSVFSENKSLKVCIVVMTTPWPGIPVLPAYMSVNIGICCCSCVTLIPIRLHANLCCRISAAKFPATNGPDSDVWEVWGGGSIC